jgi:hypothetical protein
LGFLRRVEKKLVVSFGLQVMGLVAGGRNSVDGSGGEADMRRRPRYLRAASCGLERKWLWRPRRRTWKS